MRVAVTGAGGYLGRALTDALARSEEVESVLALDIHPPPPAPKVEPRVRDVRDPRLAQDLEGTGALAHLAFAVLGNGKGAYDVNLRGSRNAFECALSAGVETILYTSSAAAYGCAADNPVPLREEHALRGVPDFYYPRTKALVEGILDELEARAPEVRVIRLRPSAILGPGVPLVFGGRFFASLSDHDPLMQFGWIGDFVDLAIRALEGNVQGPLNFGGPNPVRAARVADLLGVRALRAPHRVLRTVASATRHLPRALGGGLHPGWVDMARYPVVVATDRAERETGWRATHDSEATLRHLGALLRGETYEPPPRGAGETRAKEAAP